MGSLGFFRNIFGRGGGNPKPEKPKSENGGADELGRLRVAGNVKKVVSGGWPVASFWGVEPRF